MQMVTSGCAAWSSFATNALFHITYRPPVLFAEEERTTSHDGTTHSRRPAERKWVARGVVILPTSGYTEGGGVRIGVHSSRQAETPGDGLQQIPPPSRSDDVPSSEISWERLQRVQP